MNILPILITFITRYFVKFSRCMLILLWFWVRCSVCGARSHCAHNPVFINSFILASIHTFLAYNINSWYRNSIIYIQQIERAMCQGSGWYKYKKIYHCKCSIINLHTTKIWIWIWQVMHVRLRKISPAFLFQSFFDFSFTVFLLMLISANFSSRGYTYSCPIDINFAHPIYRISHKNDAKYPYLVIYKSRFVI